MPALTAFDVALLFVFGFSMTMGLLRGFVSELISLATIILAFILASHFAEPLANSFGSTAQSAANSIASEAGVDTGQAVSYVAISISYAAIFGGTLLAGMIVRSLMSVAFQVGITGLMNRLLGGVFGILRAYIITLVIVFLLQFTPIVNQPWWQQSFFVNTMKPQIEWLTTFVSPSIANLKAKVGQSLQDVTNKVETYTKDNLNSGLGQ